MVTMQGKCPFYAVCKACPVDKLPDSATVEQCEAACNTSECADTLYNVTFCLGDISHANLVYAQSVQSVEAWFARRKPAARLLAVEPARPDDIKPGKPTYTVAE